MDAASSQPGEITLSLSDGQGIGAVAVETQRGAGPFTPEALASLYRTAEAESCGLTMAEWAEALEGIGARCNHNQPVGCDPTRSQQLAFYHSLRLPELALAHACALGRDAAWERFLAFYREPLTHAAIAIAGSATLGHELADSLYAELFGLSTREGEAGPERRSPLASYSGRGSLLGWLRTTLSQRHIDHHRRTHRESPLEMVEATAAAAAPATCPVPGELSRLTEAVTKTLAGLDPESRFLLAAYFLDRQTLLQIARLLHVHEATVSRKLKRLTGDLRKQLLRHLQTDGPNGEPPALSRRAAEEALGTDPRDLEINLRRLLQPSQTAPFSVQPEVT